MTDDELAHQLQLLGMDAASYRALALLPLVQVAWADGTIQDAERDLILQLAEDRYALEAEGKRVLRNWLHHPPSAGYTHRGRTVLRELCGRAGFNVSRDELGTVVSLAKQVAKAAGGFFGFGAISAHEATAIDEIAAALDIPDSRRWATADDDTLIPEDADRENDGPAVEVAFHSHALEGGGGRGSAQLVLYDEARGDRSCPVNEIGISIGRGRSNTVQISYDAQVSRNHCRLYARAARIYIEDLHSVTGTWVNGERIVERRLFGGEEISVGTTVFFLQVG